MFKFKKTKKRSYEVITHRDFFEERISCGSYIPIWKNDTVYTCIDYIARQMASLSIRQYTYEDNKKMPLYDGLTRLLNDNPNNEQSRYNFIYQLVFDMFRDGVSYAGIYRYDNLIDSIEQIDGINKIGNYYFVDGERVSSNDILVFRENDGCISMTTLLKEVISNITLTDETKKVFYSGAYMPNMLVAVDTDTDMVDDEIDHENGDVTIKKTGIKNIVEKFFKPDKGDPIILPTDKFNVEQIKPMSMKDIALNESVEVDKRRIANLFGVPSYVVGIGEYSEDEYKHFVKTRLQALCVNFEKELNKKILLSPMRAFSFNLKSLLRGDAQERALIYDSMKGAGAISGNEIRYEEGMEWREGLDDPVIIGGGEAKATADINKGGDE